MISSSQAQSPTAIPLPTFPRSPHPNHQPPLINKAQATQHRSPQRSQTLEAGRAPLRRQLLSTLVTAPLPSLHCSPGTSRAEGWSLKGTGSGQGGSPPNCPGHWTPGHSPPPPLSLPSSSILDPGSTGQARESRSGGWPPAQAMIWDTVAPEPSPLLTQTGGRQRPCGEGT